MDELPVTEITQPSTVVSPIVEYGIPNPRRRRAIRRTVIALVAVAALVGGGLYVTRSRPADTRTTPALTAQSAVLKQVTGMSPTVLDQVGRGDPTLLPAPLYGHAVKIVNGHPNVLYIGAEYCSYCGVERWALLVALSRFGTFSDLKPIVTYDQGVPSFTFHGSVYVSEYVTFQAVEVYANTYPDQPLDTLSADQQATFDLVSRDGEKFPTIDFGDQSSMIGSSFAASLLIGKSQAQIAADLSTADTEIARAIGGTANAFTAQICALTHQQPSAVCLSPAATAYSVG